MSRALDEGAFGLSSGLEYEPGFQASTSEIAALAREAAATVYATHVRSEGDSALDALAEAVDVGRRTGIAVHVSHLKLASAATRGRAAAALAVLAAPGRWTSPPTGTRTPSGCRPRQLSPRRAGAGRVEHWERVIADVGGAERLTITAFAADAFVRGTDGGRGGGGARVDRGRVLRDLEGRGHAGLAAQAMDESDLEHFLRSPRVMIASDGGIRIAHPARRGDLPAGAGALRARARRDQPRVGHPQDDGHARRGGWACPTAGRIAPGARADVVVFDPATIADRATAMQPDLAPVGIHHVLVNGVAVVWDGKPTDARPGRALRAAAIPRECRASPAARRARRRAGGSRRSRSRSGGVTPAYQALSG